MGRAHLSVCVFSDKEFRSDFTHVIGGAFERRRPGRLWRNQYPLSLGGSVLNWIIYQVCNQGSSSIAPVVPSFFTPSSSRKRCGCYIA